MLPLRTVQRVRGRPASAADQCWRAKASMF